MRVLIADDDPVSSRMLDATLREWRYEVVSLQKTLADRVRELEDVLTHVKALEGILPICSYCKNIRNDENIWTDLETYMSDHSNAQFSHGICPHCYDTIVTPGLETLRQQGQEPCL